MKGKKTGGRKKGVPNKMTAAVRSMIINALDEAGGVDYLRDRAMDTPSAFLALVGRVLPLEQHISGSEGGPMTVIQRVVMSPST